MMMMSMTCWIFFIYIAISVESQKYRHIFRQKGNYTSAFTRSVRKKFEERFVDQCMSLPFVHLFVHLQENPTNKFFRFAMTDPWFHIGGLGDRLAGLVNAVALSIRFNRTLLLRSDEALFEYFRPFQYHHLLHIPRQTHSRSVEQRAHFSAVFNHSESDFNVDDHDWSNWREWSGFNEGWIGRKRFEFDLTNCVNDLGSKGDQCSMDGGDLPQFPSILMRSNRCYLCRYFTRRDAAAFNDLLSMLGIFNATNIVLEDIPIRRATGCLLRLALWPSEKLWLSIDADFHSQYPQYSSVTAHKVPSSERSLHAELWQVGLHFRCGDGVLGTSRQSTVTTLQEDNTRCVSDMTTAIFPEPLLQWLMKMKTNMNMESSETWIIQVSSDSNFAAKNLMKSLTALATKWSMPVLVNISGLPPCHIDHNRSAECLTSTLREWFQLSHSSLFLGQSLSVGAQTGYSSAFVRFAAMYALLPTSNYSAVFNNNISAPTQQIEDAVYWKTHGNWFC